MGLQDFWSIVACFFRRMSWHHPCNDQCGVFWPSVQIEASKRKRNTMIALQKKIRTFVQKGKHKISQLHTSSQLQCAIVWKCACFLFLPVLRFEIFSICSLALATCLSWARGYQNSNRSPVECRVCSWDWVSVQEHVKNDATFLLEKSCPIVRMIKVWELYRSAQQVLSVPCQSVKKDY